MTKPENPSSPREKLAAAVIADPGLIDRLQADPIGAAASVGVTLNEGQANRFRNADAGRLGQIRTAARSGDTDSTISATTGIW